MSPRSIALAARIIMRWIPVGVVRLFYIFSFNYAFVQSVAGFASAQWLQVMDIVTMWMVAAVMEGVSDQNQQNFELVVKAAYTCEEPESPMPQCDADRSTSELPESSKSEDDADRLTSELPESSESEDNSSTCVVDSDKDPPSKDINTDDTLLDVNTKVLLVDHAEIYAKRHGRKKKQCAENDWEFGGPCASLDSTSEEEEQLEYVGSEVSSSMQTDVLPSLEMTSEAEEEEEVKSESVAADEQPEEEENKPPPLPIADEKVKEGQVMGDRR